MRFGVAQADRSDQDEPAFVVIDSPSPSKSTLAPRSGSRFSAPLLAGDSSSSDTASGSSASYSSSEEDAYEEAKARAAVGRSRRTESKGEVRSLPKSPGTPTPVAKRSRSRRSPSVRSNSSSEHSGASNDERIPGQPSQGVKVERKNKQRAGERQNPGAKLHVEMDEWDAWELASKHAALIRAHTAATAFRETICSPYTARISQAASTGTPDSRSEDSARELEQVRAMLEDIDLKRAEEDRRAQEEFEKRNRELWDNIEASILAADRAEASRQAEIRARKDKEEALRLRLKQEAEAVAKKEKDEQARKAAVLAAQKGAADRAETAKREAERARAAQAEAQGREEQERLAGAGLLRGTGKKRRDWTEWTEKHKSIKAEVIEVTKADATLKRNAARPRNAIRSKIGQCTNSRDKIVSVVEDIHNVLQSAAGGFAPINTQQPMTAQRNPSILYHYLLTQTSKFLIKQAEEEVQPNPDAAYKLAKVAVGIMITGHVMLGPILMARLVKKCCFIVPYYPARAQDQSEEAYRKSVGQNLGQPEDEVQYALRMSAILRFYLAILGTDLRVMSSAIARADLQDFVGLDPFIHPSFRLAAGWSWLTGILRDPMPGYDPTPQLLIAALETIGQELTFAYGEREMGKVMMLILTTGLGMNMATGQQEAPGEIAPQNNSAREQLKILLGPLIEHGRFERVAAKQWED